MLKSFAAREALVDVDAHQPTDEILGRVANIVPVRGIEFEFTCHAKRSNKKEGPPTVSEFVVYVYIGCRLRMRNEGLISHPCVPCRLFSRSIKSKSTAARAKILEDGLLRTRELTRKETTRMGRKENSSCNRYTGRPSQMRTGYISLSIDSNKNSIPFP